MSPAVLALLLLLVAVALAIILPNLRGLRRWRAQRDRAKEEVE